MHATFDRTKISRYSGITIFHKLSILEKFLDAYIQGLTMCSQCLFHLLVNFYSNGYHSSSNLEKNINFLTGWFLCVQILCQLPQRYQPHYFTVNQADTLDSMVYKINNISAYRELIIKVERKVTYTQRTIIKNIIFKNHTRKEKKKKGVSEYWRKKKENFFPFKNRKASCRKKFPQLGRH